MNKQVLGLGALLLLFVLAGLILCSCNPTEIQLAEEITKDVIEEVIKEEFPPSQ